MSDKNQKQELPRPTDAEMAIMRVLWTRGPGTVREVMEALNEGREKDAAYTTVLKFMQIMHEKGLLQRSEDQRSHVYSPTLPAEQTQRQMVGDFVDRVFGGSALELVQQALGSGRVSPEDFSEIRKLLAEAGQPPLAD